MAERVITIEVVYASADRQHVRRVNVPETSTVMDAITASGIAEVVPGDAITSDRLGIFSRRVAADHPVEPGDRVEIYRPLDLDPMEARRKRAR
jgi:putative ubiquitin-RnfH superfamily antitoxin RatB of RatAB toxin-antitoxin module